MPDAPDRADTADDDAVQPGDLVCLMDADQRRYLVTLDGGGARHIKGVGVLDPGNLAGVPWGSLYPFGNKELRVCRPLTVDRMRGAKRKAQIVLPKDAARILLETGLCAGDRVLEAGLGSAVLTIALARAVAPTGRVTVYELREDFAAWGRGNLELAGVSDVVDVEVRDATEGIDERGLDAVVLDLPQPWGVVPHAQAALRGSGVLVAYSPLISQVERTREALEAHGFFAVRTLELLEREWVVHDRGSRPDHHMLGHTAFLTFGRKGV